MCEFHGNELPSRAGYGFHHFEGSFDLFFDFMWTKLFLVWLLLSRSASCVCGWFVDGGVVPRLGAALGGCERHFLYEGRGTTGYLG